MKRRRNMLLCVTATSMAAAVSCQAPSDPPRPVGTVTSPRDMQPTMDAGSPPANADDGVGTAEQPDASSAMGAVSRDAGSPHVTIGRTPIHMPDPSRVGTTATPRDFGPTVGTTAHAPDSQKK
jgi:hypothetical protein